MKYFWIIFALLTGCATLSHRPLECQGDVELRDWQPQPGYFVGYGEGTTRAEALGKARAELRLAVLQCAGTKVTGVSTVYDSVNTTGSTGAVSKTLFTYSQAYVEFEENRRYWEKDIEHNRVIYRAWSGAEFDWAAIKRSRQNYLITLTDSLAQVLDKLNPAAPASDFLPALHKADALHQRVSRCLADSMFYRLSYTPVHNVDPDSLWQVWLAKHPLKVMSVNEDGLSVLTPFSGVACRYAYAGGSGELPADSDGLLTLPFKGNRGQNIDFDLYTYQQRAILGLPPLLSYGTGVEVAERYGLSGLSNDLQTGLNKDGFGGHGYTLDLVGQVTSVQKINPHSYAAWGRMTLALKKRGRVLWQRDLTGDNLVRGVGRSKKEAGQKALDFSQYEQEADLVQQVLPLVEQKVLADYLETASGL